jgi:hypothetical protein
MDFRDLKGLKAKNFNLSVGYKEQQHPLIIKIAAILRP